MTAVDQYRVQNTEYSVAVCSVHIMLLRGLSACVNFVGVIDASSTDALCVVIGPTKGAFQGQCRTTHAGGTSLRLTYSNLVLAGVASRNLSPHNEM